MKIVVITCYFDPDYVRARSLRAALQQIPGVEIVVIKNSSKGIWRYPEIIWKIWRAKHTVRPDVYLLTFRGQEILPALLWLASKKPVWFDELIVPIAYATGEKHVNSLSIRVKHFLARLSAPFYKRWLRSCSLIIADTKAHAELSAHTSGVPLDRYAVVPVGTDETLFRPPKAPIKIDRTFRVFYYSTGMQPLHGVPVVLEAAELLRKHPDIEFFIVGGRRPMERLVMVARSRGAHIKYAVWIPFDDLRNAMYESSVGLGGPFGNTPQAHHVVTTKTYQFLACGRPVIVGASEATNQYFFDKQNALVVPQGDPQALVDAILWAKSHPTELAAIAARGRVLYEKEFSTEAIARILAPHVASW